MCLEVGRIDGDRLAVGRLGSKTRHDPRKHPHIAPALPALPAIVERLVGTVFSGRIAPTQAVSVEKDDSAWDAPVVNTRHPKALGTVRSTPLQLSVAQPVQGAHVVPPKFGSLDQAASDAATKSMGPEPKHD